MLAETITGLAGLAMGYVVARRYRRVLELQDQHCEVLAQTIAQQRETLETQHATIVTQRETLLAQERAIGVLNTNLGRSQSAMIRMRQEIAEKLEARGVAIDDLELTVDVMPEFHRVH